MTGLFARDAVSQAMVSRLQVLGWRRRLDLSIHFGSPGLKASSGWQQNYARRVEHLFDRTSSSHFQDIRYGALDTIHLLSADMAPVPAAVFDNQSLEAAVVQLFVVSSSSRDLVAYLSQGVPYELLVPTEGRGVIRKSRVAEMSYGTQG